MPAPRYEVAELPQPATLAPLQLLSAKGSDKKKRAIILDAMSGMAGIVAFDGQSLIDRYLREKEVSRYADSILNFIDTRSIYIGPEGRGMIHMVGTIAPDLVVDYESLVVASTNKLTSLIEIVRKLLDNTDYINDPLASREAHNMLNEWREESFLMSSSADAFALRSYRKIVVLGKAVIPILLEELQMSGDHFDQALHEITGANPVSSKDAGNMSKVIMAWINWGRSNGYINKRST